VSQPAPFSKGKTVVVPRTQVSVTESVAGGLHVVNRTVTVSELARALNSLGVTPRDLIAIFQALKQSGALHAELVVQ
jgi:flagellar P-ring protein precursor FlgI